MNRIVLKTDYHNYYHWYDVDLFSMELEVYYEHSRGTVMIYLAVMKVVLQLIASFLHILCQKEQYFNVNEYVW